MSVKLAVIAAAAVASPVTLLVGVGIIAGGDSYNANSALAAATITCVYAYPDGDRIADTMSALTNEPVQPAHWDRYANLIGVDAEVTSWEDSTDSERDELLHTAVRSLLYTHSPAAVTSPPLLWWYGSVPTDDNDTWHTASVPGWSGDLDDYLSEFVNTYATIDQGDTDEHECIPPYASSCGQPAEMAAILATIRDLESGDNYTEQSHTIAGGRGSAGSGYPSGAYQFLANTWNDYGGYSEAFLAPPSVQDERASIDIDTILRAFDGDPAWVPVAWYVGMGGARKVKDGTWSTAYTPNPAFNRISIGDYQAKWLDHYLNTALPTTGVAVNECPQGGLAAVAWAETQLGAPYAAIDPYRFGSPLWPGGTRIGSRGNTYTFPAGTAVYDCSGFIVAAWRAAGVDLVAQYGLYGSQAFPGSPLEEIHPTVIAPGDLAVYSTVNNVGHIVMIHHIDPDGTARTIEASPSRGVYIGTVNWPRVISIKRPALTP